MTTMLLLPPPPLPPPPLLLPLWIIALFSVRSFGRASIDRDVHQIVRVISSLSLLRECTRLPNKSMRPAK